MAKAKTELEAVPMDTPIARAALEIRPVVLINPTDHADCWFVRSLSFNGWTLLPVENPAGLYKAIPDVILTPDPAALEVCSDSDAWEFLEVARHRAARDLIAKKAPRNHTTRVVVGALKLALAELVTLAGVDSDVVDAVDAAVTLAEDRKLPGAVSIEIEVPE